MFKCDEDHKGKLQGSQGMMEGNSAGVSSVPRWNSCPLQHSFSVDHPIQGPYFRFFLLLNSSRTLHSSSPVILGGT